LLIEHTFARQDAAARERAAIALDRLRRAGATVLVVSHEEELLHRLCDEIWWLRDGKLARRGDGRAEVLRVETIGENGHPTMVWRSGELAQVRVTVRFRDAVADPVIGM